MRPGRLERDRQRALAAVQRHRQRIGRRRRHARRPIAQRHAAVGGRHRRGDDRAARRAHRRHAGRERVAGDDVQRARGACARRRRRAAPTARATASIGGAAAARSADATMQPTSSDGTTRMRPARSISQIAGYFATRMQTAMVEPAEPEQRRMPTRAWRRAASRRAWPRPSRSSRPCVVLEQPERDLDGDVRGGLFSRLEVGRREHDAVVDGDHDLRPSGASRRRRRCRRTRSRSCPPASGSCAPA